MHRFMSLRKPQLTIQYANKMTLIFALSGGDILHLQISSVFQFLFQLYLEGVFSFKRSQGLIPMHSNAYVFNIFLLLPFSVHIQMYKEKVNRKYDNCII